MNSGLLLCALALFAGGDLPRTGVLLEHLKSPEYETRLAAVHGVKGRTEPELLDRLIEVARDDDHPNIRAAAAEVLSSFRDPRVYPTLVHLLDTAKHTVTKRAAYVALGAIRDPRAKKLLLRGIEDGPDTRAWAVKGLGLLGDPSTFDTVAGLFKDRKGDPNLLPFVSIALIRLAPERAASFLLPRFAELPDFERRSLAEVLKDHPVPGTRQAMERHLASDDGKLRECAIWLLGRLRDPKAVPALLKLCEKESRDLAEMIVPLMAIHSLGEIGTQEVLPALLPFANTERSSLRSTATREICRIRDAKAVPDLIRALGEAKRPALRVALISALARSGDARAIASLAPSLEDRGYEPARGHSYFHREFPYNTPVKLAAAWAILTLRDGTPPFRADATSALGNRPDRTAEVRKWWKANSADPRYRLPD